MSWLDRPAREIARAVRRAEVTPRAIAAEARARAAERNPAINAICADNPGLEAEADAVAARLEAGAHLPLAGVPVLIKDNIWIEGLRVAQGSRLFAEHVAPCDAEAVARLRQAGAMVLGIATCSEFACKGATFSPLHGITRNPVDTSLTPGGSSGGSAAAVAAGIVPLALGTDAGGSSRRPPAHVGVCGFKPTQDLIPYGPGFDEPVWGISTICPIARDMGDIALAMEVLAGVAPEPPAALALAAAPTFGLDQPVDPAVADAFADAMAAVRAAGGTVAPARIDWPAGLRGSDALPLQYAGLAHLYAADWRDTPEAFDPDIAAQIRAGTALSGAEVAAAHQASHAMRVALRTALDRDGVIATPTTPCAAWAADRLAPAEIAGLPAAPRDHAAFTPQANHAGVPALTIPFGTDGAGRPLGLQLIAGEGQDGALMGLAHALEGILEEVDRCVFS